MSAIDVLRSDHVAKTRERARLAARVEELDRELAELVDALELFGVRAEAEARQAAANAPPDPPHEVPIVPATPTELEPAE